MINDNSKSNVLNDTSFGGLPVADIGKATEWPTCRTCGAEMQYLGKIKTDIGLELLYLCNNDPGMCNEWKANGGGNKVEVIDSDTLEFVKPTNPELSRRKTDYGVRIVEVEATDYDTARENWSGTKRDVLGQLYGEPAWLRSDETPTCDCCHKPMRFVAQLEQGPDYETEMNFGGGAAYVFDCVEGRTAKFLSQC